MPFVKGQSGNPKGKPKGAISKPRFADYLSEEQVKNLIKKAYELADKGNEKMLAFILEQKFGKAPQAVELEGTIDLSVNFDSIFKDVVSDNK